MIELEDLPELPWSWISDLSRAEADDTRSVAADRLGVVTFLLAGAEGKAVIDAFHKK